MPLSLPWPYLLLSSTAVAVAASAWWQWRHTRARVLTVLDGDTYEVLTQRGTRVRVRLWGVDCPERDQPLGAVARDVAKTALDRQWVRLRWRGRDRHRRRLAEVVAPTGNLADLLVQRGLAVPLPHYRGHWRAWGARWARRGVWAPGTARPWQARSRRQRWRWWR